MINDINKILLELNADETKYLINYIISYYNFIYCEEEEIINIIEKNKF